MRIVEVAAPIGNGGHAMRTLGLVLVVAALGVPALAADYHVSTKGSDTAMGGEERPFLTIARGVKALQPGDTLHIAAGVYKESVEVRALKGTADKPITIRGATRTMPMPSAGGKDRAIPTSVRGSPRTIIEAAGRDALLLWQGCEHIVVEHLTARGGQRAGILCGGSQHITIRNCECVDNGVWGVQTSMCTYITVEDCELAGSKREHGVYFSTTDYPVARRNLIRDCAGCGVHMNGDKREGGDGMITAPLIERNTIRNCGARGGAAVNGDSIEKAVIRNNLIYDCLAGGIVSFHSDGDRAGDRNQVLNNTVVFRPDQGRYGIRIAGGAGHVIQNNILVTGRRPALEFDAAAFKGLVSDGNVLCASGPILIDDKPVDLATWQAERKQDAHAQSADPQFVDPARGDFRLKDTSGARDSGVPVSDVTDDLVGTTRPKGKGIDRGAYEQ
jgi:hypothetical protein